VIFKYYIYIYTYTHTWHELLYLYIYIYTHTHTHTHTHVMKLPFNPFKPFYCVYLLIVCYTILCDFSLYAICNLLDTSFNINRHVTLVSVWYTTDPV